MDRRRRLTLLHAELEACRACPSMFGPPVHGPPIVTDILLVGQAPGPREGNLGRPFAWTAGKTLFRWFEEATGVDEPSFRAGVYMTAVARCFPGKANGGGDRRPDRDEIARCRRFLSGELETLHPQLIIPVGTLAIEQTLGHKGPLVDIVGAARRTTVHGVEADVIALPHPSGASTWHRLEPGRSLLSAALARIAAHPAWLATFATRPHGPIPRLPPPARGPSPRTRIA
ncbi:MAG: uracil-DNA glycosylase [Myxococcales bacterium]|nr:uracil-DNA glycosylase [Myxococcales bacterium]